MAQLPELPLTDDPFALLGVAPSVSERELKQAYVRLIKVYRPERAPEEFQRLQEAYQRARDRLAGASSPDPSPRPEGHDTTGPETVVGEKRSEGPREEASAGGPGPWDEVRRSQPLTFSDRQEELDDLVTGLLAGVPVAQSLIDHSSDWEWSDHSGLKDVDWRILRKQQPRSAAAELLLIRFESLLGRGRYQQVFDELNTPELLRDALTDEDLEAVAVYVACAATWEYRERAAELFDKYTGSPKKGSLAENLHFLYLHLSGMAEAWQALISQAPPPAGLTRFLSLAPVSDDDRLAQLARELVRDLGFPDNQAKEVGKRRLAYLATLDALIKQEAGPIELLCSVTTDVIQASRPGDSVHSAPAQEDACVFQVKRIDRSLRRQRNFLRGWYQSLFGFFLILGIPLLLLIQGWLKGAALGLSIAILLYLPYFWLDRRFYRRHVRPRALDVIQSTMVTSDRFAEVVRAHEKKLEVIDEFVSDIEGDEALSILSAVIQLGSRSR